MILLPSILMGTFLTIGLTVLAITVVLIFLFKSMYHTFHGNLPSKMRLVVAVLLVIGVALIILNYII